MTHSEFWISCRYNPIVPGRLYIRIADQIGLLIAPDSSRPATISLRTKIVQEIQGLQSISLGHALESVGKIQQF